MQDDLQSQALDRKEDKRAQHALSRKGWERDLKGTKDIYDTSLAACISVLCKERMGHSI
jgi:hypothetical protein